MRADDIIELIDRKTQFDQETLSDLENLIEEYPYFQTAQLLYALNLNACKDTRFPEQLRKTACYMGDRRKLFFLVEEEFFSPVVIESLERRDKITVDSPFDLIDLFLSEKTTEKKGVKSEPQASAESSQQLISTDYMSYILSEEAQKQELKAQPMQYQDAIDKFLEEDGKSPIKIELKEQVNGKEPQTPDLDTVDENSFFSETLAKIYLKQKKYEKALEIIRKLNLVYPEKNIYFADQIRFLERLIINTKK